MEYIDKAEIRHILNEFQRLNSPFDAAMLFCVRPECELEDLMRYDYHAKKYHLDVWKHIMRYTIEKIENGKYEQILNDIIPKLYVEGFQYKEDKDAYSSDYLVCSYLSKLFRILVEAGLYELYSYTLSLLQIQGFSNIVLSKLIREDTSLHIPNLILMYMQLGIYNAGEIVDLMLLRKDALESGLVDKILNLFFTEEGNILNLLTELDMNRVWIYEKKFKNKIEIMEEIKGSKKEQEVIRYIIKFLGSKVVVDANILLVERLSKAYDKYTEEKNLVLSNRYSEYINWFNDVCLNMNNKKLLNNYVTYGGEEGDHFDEEFYYEFRSDPFQLFDFYELESMSDYKFFLTIFNMNRFRLYNDYHDEYLDKVLNRISTYDENRIYLAELALSTSFYYIINLFVYPYI